MLSGHRIKLYIPKEGVTIAFNPSGVRCPQRGQAAAAGRPAVEVRCFPPGAGIGRSGWVCQLRVGMCDLASPCLAWTAAPHPALPAMLPHRRSRTGRMRCGSHATTACRCGAVVVLGGGGVCVGCVCSGMVACARRTTNSVRLLRPRVGHALTPPPGPPLFQRDCEVEVTSVDRVGNFQGTVRFGRLNLGGEPGQYCRAVSGKIRAGQYRAWVVGRCRKLRGLGVPAVPAVALLEAGLAKLHPSFDPYSTPGGKELEAAQAKARSQKLKVGAVGGAGCMRRNAARRWSAVLLRPTAPALPRMYVWPV